MSKVTNFHMCMDVRGAIRNLEWKGSLVGACFHDDGRKMTSGEILNELLDAVAAGKKVLPFCKVMDCPNFDFQTGCPGHEVPDPVPQR